MDPIYLGVVAAVTLVVLLMTGMPVAFALGVTAVTFLLIQDGVGAFEVVAETLFASLDEFALLSIPMFLLMGSAIAASRAGSDLYEALDRWLYRVHRRRRQAHADLDTDIARRPRILAVGAPPRRGQ